VLTRDGEIVRLTTSETALLDLLARQGRRDGDCVMSCLRRQWRTVNGKSMFQMTRLRRKLGRNPSEPRYLLTVRARATAFAEPATRELIWAHPAPDCPEMIFRTKPTDHYPANHRDADDRRLYFLQMRIGATVHA